MTSPSIAYKKKTTANRPNDFGLERLDLILDSESVVPLLEIYVQIELSQDLFGSPLICEVIITDGNDLYDNLPFKNNEILDIEFYSPGGDVVSKKMRMFSHSEVMLNENRKTSYYKLKFCSIETLINMSTKVSRSYTGTLSDIAGAIWSDTFTGSEPIKTVPSYGEHTIVLPYDSPFSHIKKFSRKAFSDPEENLCDFLFFEDFNGFNFTSINSLTSQPNRAYFRYQDPNTDIKEGDEANVLKSTYIMKDVSLKGSRDLIDNIGRGVYNSFVNITDIKNKTYVAERLNFNDLFPVKNNLNPDSPFPASVVDEFGPLSCYGHKFVSQYSPTSSMKRSSVMGSMFFNKIKFECGGNSSLNVGDIVKLDFVPQSAQTTLDEKYDQYRSGNYIVSQISHIINRQTGYTISIETCSGSVSKPIPEKSEFESSRR